MKHQAETAGLIESAAGVAGINGEGNGIKKNGALP